MTVFLIFSWKSSLIFLMIFPSWTVSLNIIFSTFYQETHDPRRAIQRGLPRSGIKVEEPQGSQTINRQGKERWCQSQGLGEPARQASCPVQQDPSREQNPQTSNRRHEKGVQEPRKSQPRIQQRHQDGQRKGKEDQPDYLPRLESLRGNQQLHPCHQSQAWNWKGRLREENQADAR